jgi:DNA-directed RNA polymerase specialized sigma24 family protein
MSRAERFLRELDPLRRPIAATCQRLLWQPADLEDALQETLALAFRRFEEPRESAFRPWVFRIATWTCFGFNRRHTPLVEPASPRVAISSPTSAASLASSRRGISSGT